MEKTFQQLLEDFRDEVSIEVYPTTCNGSCTFHYQIYKPAYSGRHCWEVYRNPKDDEREVEVDMSCNTLDDAWRMMICDIAACEANEAKWSAFLEAADVVCGECGGTENQCRECMVRKTHDKLCIER